jgi:hypothetical protein
VVLEDRRLLSTLTVTNNNDSGRGSLRQAILAANAHAGADGGGIFNGASGALAVKDSTVLGNTASSGADIYNLGELALDDSTVGVIGP